MDDQPKTKIIFVITIVGETPVGKTSIINAFLGFRFNYSCLATLGNEKNEKEVQIETGENVKLKIWDTPGKERLCSIAENVIRICKGAIVVFDLTDKRSFEKIIDWTEKIRVLTREVPICLFGNKSDLSNRKVTQEEIDKLCKEQNLVYFETSAKNNTGITEGFNKLANLINQVFGNRINKNIILRETQNRPKKEKSC